MKPVVSLIIPTFNTKKMTIRCLETIKKYLTLPHEVIVVDNGSDGTDQVIKDCLVIKNQENQGFARAVNRGMKQAKGDYFLLLNSDVFIKKGAVEKLIKVAKNQPDCGVVGGKLILGNGQTQFSIMSLPTLTNTFARYWFGKERKTLPTQTQPVEAVVGAVFLITPQAQRKVGLMDERYFMYFEDLDYCRRVKQAGLKVYFCPEAEFTHLHGESGKKLADTANQWKRLIPGSQIYHGRLKHYLITLVIWVSQKVR